MTENTSDRWVRTELGWRRGRWIITSRKMKTVQGYDPDHNYSLFDISTGRAVLTEVSSGLQFLENFADNLDRQR